MHAITLWILALSSLAGESLAQTYQGGVRGAVRDATGVIPGVVVTLTEQERNLERTTVTDEGGQYVFSSVPPGVYRVAASLPSFRPFERIDQQQLATSRIGRGYCAGG